MTNSEMQIEKLEVWNGPSRPPYYSAISLKINFQKCEFSVAHEMYFVEHVFKIRGANSTFVG